MADFEKAAFTGLERDQANIFWVRHKHMGNVELHSLIPRVELYGNRLPSRAAICSTKRVLPQPVDPFRRRDKPLV